MKRNRTKGKPNNKAVKSIPTQLGLQTLQNDGRVEVRIMSQFFPAQVVSSAIATVFGALYFRVSDMAGNGDMVAAFDQFKIAEVDVTFIPNQDKVTASAVTNGNFFTVIDFDDATVLATLNQVFGYSTLVRSKGTEVHKRRLVPRIAVAAYQGAFSASANVSPWIDSGSIAVQHFGLKYAWTVTTTAQTMDMFVRMKVLWRGRRLT